MNKEQNVPNHITLPTPGCSTTDGTLTRGPQGKPISMRHNSKNDQFAKESYRLRNEDSDFDKDISDHQRSLSEGRLVDSRDGLSQSHDSVFSESVGTASSVSITYKTELADVLKRRRHKDRNNHGEVSDEDLGLPQSPITPQKKDRTMNKSEGSLSVLSMTSSDMDDEQSSLTNFDSSLNSSTFSKSFTYNTSANSEDVVVISSNRLTHLAAKHKMAIKPKKKGPTRPRRSRDPTILPSTPEVNEDVFKVSSSDMTDNTTKTKSKGATSTPLKHKEKTSIYINKEEDRIITTNQKAEDGFFKRILNYSFKKKKQDEDKIKSASTDSFDDPKHTTVSVTVSPVTIKIPGNEDETSIIKLQKIGPASRQRVFPKEIEMNKYASNIEMHRSSVTSANDIRVSMHKSEEYLVKMRKHSENEEVRKSSETSQYKVPKIYGLSPYQQKVTKIVVNNVDIDEKNNSPIRKPVEKSKSFRIYSDNLSNNLHTANNLPSLPNLSGPLSIGNFSNNFLETEHKFFSMTENMNIGKTKVYKDYISNLEDNNTNSQDSLEECKSMTSIQKFEINDYNLMNPRESPIDQQPKSIVMTSNAIQEQQSSSVILNKSSQNISQIEENIDKLVSSPFDEDNSMRLSSMWEYFNAIGIEMDVKIKNNMPKSLDF